jgi:hypothetical protein
MMATLNDLAAIGAPLLASVLGGPPGLAFGAMSLVTKSLGLPSNASVADITSKIQSNPELAIQLKDLEANYQQYLLSVKLQMDQAEYADRANAREREVQLAKVAGGRDWYPPALGTLVVLAFTVVLCSMIFTPKSAEQRDDYTKGLVNILVGALTAGYSTVLGYYFGSSAGSRQKDTTIANFTSEPSASVGSTQPPPPLPAVHPPAPSPLRKSWKDP